MLTFCENLNPFGNFCAKLLTHSQTNNDDYISSLAEVVAIYEHRRPDIVVVYNKTSVLIDITVPGDTRVEEKEQENVDKYQNLTRELKK